MRVKFGNKKLVNKTITMASIIAAFVSLLLAFVEFDRSMRIIIGIAFIIVVVLIYIVLLISANRMRQLHLRINDTDVNIIQGDIFCCKGIKVIPFNEFFDTNVNDSIISKTTLNGKYIESYSKGVSFVDSVIEDDVRLKDKIVDYNCKRKYGGKTIKYRLGTIIKIDDYGLLAFTRFNENNSAVLSVEDYIASLMHMWSELDILYGGRAIYIPLLGAGVTRINNSGLSPQELLNTILWTYKVSKISFSAASITIVLDEKALNKINLFEMVTEGSNGL